MHIIQEVVRVIKENEKYENEFRGKLSGLWPFKFKSPMKVQIWKEFSFKRFKKWDCAE